MKIYCLLLLCLLSLTAGLACSGSGSGGSDGSDPRFPYWTGPSTLSGHNDSAFPGDNNNLGERRINLPGGNKFGAYRILELLALPDLILAPRHNADAATTTGSMLHHHQCAAAGLGTFVDICDGPGDDATCDAVESGALCTESEIYVRENPVDTPAQAHFDGIESQPFDRVVFEPGINDCTRTNATVEKTITALDALMESFFAAPNVERLVLVKSLGWRRREVQTSVCAELWESSCGADCDNTIEDLVALPKWGGNVVISDHCYEESKVDNKYDHWSDDGLHVNAYGMRACEIGEHLRHLGILVTDTAPPTPVLRVDSVTDTTADVHFDQEIVDPDGDALTCVVWAVEDGESIGHYQAADRLSNQFCFCQIMNGGTPCPDCGDEPADTDCISAPNDPGWNGTFADADAIKFMTCANAPPTPDGLSGGNAFPDLFEVTGTDLVTIHGLAPGTHYRLGAYCMPDLVAGTASRGILPSELDDSQTFTTTL